MRGRVTAHRASLASGGQHLGMGRSVRSLHDAYLAACGRKVAYHELEAAKAVADALTCRSPFDEILTVYRCPFGPLGSGGHYHVGHRRGTKPSPSLLRARPWSAPRITLQGSAPSGPPETEAAPRRPRRRRRRTLEGAEPA
jgi:hypothetical protein